MTDLKSFLAESNRIEGILREPTHEEIETAAAFLELDVVATSDIENIVSIFQPNAKLRSRVGMNVRVGSYCPPGGGRMIEIELIKLLKRAIRGYHSAFTIHHDYEKLHPFTDGNGRSGRMIWAWMMTQQDVDRDWLRRGFLHTWYYQTLENGRRP